VPASVELLLLRTHLPELVLRPGMVLAARVLEREGARGVLQLAGVALAAQLPEDVEPGARLRLEVAEVGPERLVLRVQEQQPGPPPPAGVALPLPDGADARVRVEERDPGDAAGGRPPSVALAYESPALGRLDLRLELPAGGIVASVAAPAGASAERVRAAAGELRAALARATGLPATVRIADRHDPIDVYA
jgi:hypothetical protein